MKFKINALLGVNIILFALQVAILSSCEQINNWTNDPPKINSLTVPKAVEYGETVEFRVKTFDPEDDYLTYLWDVSDGTLKEETEATVEWVAPPLPDGGIVQPETVTVSVFVSDGGDEETSESALIIVSSKAYEVANALSGTYKLVRTRVSGKTVEPSGGTMRLTTTTFTRQFEEDSQFFFGSYELIEPFDNKKGTIHWYFDDQLTPTVSTYTWDGKLLIIFSPATSTAHVYQKEN